MLREFLFAHTFLGRILVILPLFACFFMPLGFSLHSRWETVDPNCVYAGPACRAAGLVLVQHARVVSEHTGAMVFLLDDHVDQ